MSSSKIVHAPMPYTYGQQTRCKLPVGGDVQCDEQCFSCPECLSGVLYDMNVRMDSIEKGISSLRTSMAYSSGTSGCCPDW